MDALIVGHHSHTIQPVVRHENIVVCYSLGNFCFDDIDALKIQDFKVRMTPRNKEGLVVFGDILQHQQKVPELHNFSFVGTQMVGSSIKLSQRVGEKVEELNQLFTRLSITEIEQRRKDDFNDQVAYKFGQQRGWRWVVNRLNYNTIIFKLLVIRNGLIYRFLKI